MPLFQNGSIRVDNKPLLLFGSSQWAEYCAYILEVDANCEIAAFTTDDKFCTQPDFAGRPLVPFSQIRHKYSPDEVDVFVSAGFLQHNQLRERRLADLTALGYHPISYVSSRSSVWPNLKIEENIAIHEQAIIQPFCSVAKNAHVLSGANISHHSTIGENSFVAGDVSIAGAVTVGRNCFLGMNSTVLEQRSIGDFVTLAAGSVLTEDALVPGVYAGAPAKLKKRFDLDAITLDASE